MLDGGYVDLNITTELWQKHEGYVRYYYWISYSDGKLCTVTKYRKELYEGEITLFKEKIDKRRKFILEKELEGYEQVTGDKKKSFEIDAFSPIHNIMYKKSTKNKNIRGLKVSINNKNTDI